MFPEAMNINAYECIRVTLAGPDKIRSWSKGEVTKPETQFAAGALARAAHGHLGDNARRAD